MYKTNKLDYYWLPTNAELEPRGFIKPAHFNSDFFVPTKSGSPVIH